MQYGYFDNNLREYVIDKVNVPVSFTNYIGVNSLTGVFNHTAGGYLFDGSAEYNRITRFRANSVPMDRPGHYVYIRDDDTGDYWSVSWQPVGKDLISANYQCRHGLSYCKYSCDYSQIEAEQTMFIPTEDEVELWDVKIKNNSGKERNLSVYSYCEFSFHHIDIDNRNFQMSLYCAGSSYENGVIEHDLYYEQNGYQYFTSNFEPDGFDCLRDDFIGSYRTESNPLTLETGVCKKTSQKGGNHCGVLQKKIKLKDGQSERLVFMLGTGKRESAYAVKEKYSNLANVDEAFLDLAAFWASKLSKLQIATPNEGMNALINIWTLYQSEINVMHSRFASFIEVGGRTGLGYRDTAQDSMTITHSAPACCKKRIEQLLMGLTSQGYGLHLFSPEWFDPNAKEAVFKSPTVVPSPDKSSMIHGINDVCADDALWLVTSIVEYIRETGDMDFANKIYTYADGGSGTVYEHLTKILDFSTQQVGAHGVCKGLRADWNDCLNLGGGESAMVSFLHVWALGHFVELATAMGRNSDAKRYNKLRDEVIKVCDNELWDGDWYLRGITADGRGIGSHKDTEGKVHLESNTWAVISGASSAQKGTSCMDAVHDWLSTPCGIMLNAPSYTKPDDSIGFVTRVYPGLKENGAIFSHPNPWAWVAEAMLGRGDRAMQYYDSLSPYNQNNTIETRLAEPYVYCQFVAGKDHTLFGKAHHPFMTGTAGWAYYAATRYILGIRPEFDSLTVDPCIPSSWQGFKAARVFRGAIYNIEVQNPDKVQKGVKSIIFNGTLLEGKIPYTGTGTTNTVKVIMG